jgi:anthocyanidin reductase
LHDVDRRPDNAFAGVRGLDASMVLMEKEACRFAQEHSIELVTVCPVATVGKAPAARKIPASVPACLSLLSGT